IAGRPADRVQPSKSTGRLRSACDSCHQAKTKCSGGSKCLSCAVSQIPCTYSPGNRLGRPKGSKNKRVSLRGNKRKTKNITRVDTFQWAGSERHQQQADSMMVEFDLEHTFDTSLAGGCVAHGNHRRLLSPDLMSLVDEIPRNHVKIGKPEEIRNMVSAQPLIDCFLKGVQLANIPWKSLMQCARCLSQDIEKEVFLLFAMSIRILLSAAQRLNINIDPVDTSRKATAGRAVSGACDVEVSVGTFVLTGAVKAEVIAVVLQQELRSVISALYHLCERASRSSQLPVAHLANTNSNSTGSAALKTYMDALSGIRTGSPKPTEHDSPPLANLSSKDIGTLLEILHHATQAMK
ncbi:MAG: hypothetical protein Q9160_002648, partial [Pyrenula sp. 1 TL-2023]